MKRIAVAFAAAGVITGMLTLAPVSLADQPSSGPAEFELAAPARALGTVTAAAEGFVSEPIEAPGDFTMLGFLWSGDSTPAIAVRTSENGIEWEPWTPLPPEADGGPQPGSTEAATATPEGVSQPIWAGHSRFVQYRMSHRPSGLRIHFVDTDQLGGESGSTRVGAVDFPSGGDNGGGEDGSGQNSAATTTSSGGKVTDSIIKRKKWDPKNDCRPREKSKKGKVKAAVVHHTVNANDYRRKDAASMVLGICRFHRNVNGWDDIGYNFVVDRFGDVFEGRNGGVERANVGAHAVGFNDQTSGVANLGTFSKEKQRDDALKAEGELIQWLGKVHDFDPVSRTKLISGGGSGNRFKSEEKVKVKAISGHRDVGQTECPGTQLYGQLGKVRDYAN